jgi:hypothetical protein
MNSVRALRRILPSAWPLLAALGAAACHQQGLPIAKSSPEPAHAALSASMGSSTPAYVGRWAVTASACEDRPWSLASDQLRSPGPFSCTFEQVTPTLAGYTVNALCRVGKANAFGRLELTMARLPSGPSLTVSGGPFQEPIGLTRCPEPVQAAAKPADGQG